MTTAQKIMQETIMPNSYKSSVLDDRYGLVIDTLQKNSVDEIWLGDYQEDTKYIFKDGSSIIATTKSRFIFDY